VSIPAAVRVLVVTAILGVTAYVLPAAAQTTGSVPPASTQPSSPQLPSSPMATPTPRVGTGEGLDTLAGCLNANGLLLVEVLFDSSGSLRSTDPEAQRVPALKAALGSLMSLTNTSASSTSANPPVVEVEMSLFDDSYRKGEGFRKLDASSLASFLEQADRFASENRGAWTDYVSALQGANASLAERAEALSAQGKKSCRALFWFTDGAYDISGTAVGAKSYAPGVGGRAAQDVGRAVMCDQGGVADQLRQAGVVNVAVALTGGGFTASDLGLLQGIVVGTPQCGTPDGASRAGVLLDVSDVNRLTSTMLEAVSGTRGLPQPSVGICLRTPCSQQVVVNIPSGVGSFYLLTRSADGVQRWVAPPGETPTLVQPGRTKIGNSSIEAIQISPTTLMLDVTLDAGRPATGPWAVTFVDPSGSLTGARGEVDAYFFGALRPVIDSSSEIRQGDAADIVVQVVDAAGDPASVSAVQQTRLTLAVTDPVKGTVTRPTVIGPDAEGRFRARYTASMTSNAAAMNVTALLSLVLDGGLALRPTIAEKAIPVTVPVTVPSLITTELELPKVEGTGTTRGVVTVSGPEKGAGRACIVGWSTERVPSSVGSVSNQSIQDCQTVQQGSTSALTVALKPDRQGDGVVTGLVEISLEQADGNEKVTKSVPVVFRTLRSTSAPVQLLTVVGLTLLGLFFPLLAFYGALRLMSGFRGLAEMQWAEVPVRIENGVIQRTDVGTGDGSAGAAGNFARRPDGDWHYVGAGDGRSFSVGRSRSFTVEMVVSMFGLNSALISVDRGTIVGRVQRPRRFLRSGGVFVPLDLTGQWALAIDTIEFPASDGVLGAAPQSTELDAPTRSVVTGSILLFVDAWHGWSRRGDQVFVTAQVEVPNALEPHILAAWRRHCSESISSTGGPGEPVAAGNVPFGSNSAGVALPWMGSEGSTASPDPGSGSGPLAPPSWLTGSDSDGS